MAGWLTGYERKETENCGNYTAPNAGFKSLLHTTESGFGSIDGVYNLFKGLTLDSPHFTIDPGTFRRMQHAPIDKAACALRGSGRAATNGAMCFQTEICGWAAQSHTWNDNVLMFIAKHLVDVRRGVFEHYGKTFPLETSLTFYGTDAGFILATTGAKQRLSPNDFVMYVGIIGHQHVHDNDHWDPGKLDVKRILEFAKVIEAEGEYIPNDKKEWDEMATEAEVQKALEAALLKVVPAGLLSGQWEKDTRALFGATAIIDPLDIDPKTGQPTGKQWLIGHSENGPYRVHIKNPQTKEIFLLAEVIRDGLNLQTLPAHLRDAFYAIPEAEV